MYALMARLWTGEVELARWVESEAEDDQKSPGGLALEPT
jgi:hypothetical protein